MSTTRLATLVGCTPRHIEMIETGKRTPSLSLLRGIAATLGVRTAVLLGEAPRDSQEPGRPQVADLERAMFTYRTPEELEPVGIEQIRERLLATRTTWYTSQTKYSQTMRDLPGLISSAEQLVLNSAATPSRQATAAGVASDVYILARGVLKHLGRIDLAHLAADRAMRYAQEAGDPVLAAHAQWNLGQSLLSDDMPDLAYDVARAAIERLEPHLPDGGNRHFSLYGGLHLLASVALARTQQEQAARELLRGPAWKIARRVDEQNPMLGVFFGEQNVKMHMVSVEADVHQPDAAVRLAEEVDLSQVKSVERRTTHLVHVAKACEEVNDDSASMILLLRIERECPEELDHKRLLREMVASMARRASPTWAPEVRYLARRHNIPF